MRFVDSLDIHASMKQVMSPALNRSSAIRRFEHGNAIEIRDGITFDFYTGLPHVVLFTCQTHCQISDCSMTFSQKLKSFQMSLKTGMECG